MSSRQDEKAARRAEREAQEQAATRAATRNKRLQLIGGGLAAVLVLGGAVALAASSLGGNDSSGAGTAGAATTSVPVPPVKEADLSRAAAAAKCELLSPAVEGSTHVTGKVVYKTNPPSSGDHNQVWAEDGYYAPGNEPEKENWVHSLEHGRVLLQYAPATPARTIAQLETVGAEELNGSAHYKVLALQNNTEMPFKVAAVSWGKILGCPTMTPAVFDAIRAFRRENTDKGPELIP